MLTALLLAVMFFVGFFLTASRRYVQFFMLVAGVLVGAAINAWA